jgi:hypothetical protein
MLPKSGISWGWEPSLFFGSFFWAMTKERTVISGQNSKTLDHHQSNFAKTVEE